MLFRSMIRSDTAGMQVTINLAARHTQYNLLRLTAECGSDVDGRLYATVLRTKRIANRTAAERPAVKICTPSCPPIACDSRLPFSHLATRRGRGSTIPPQWRDSESLSHVHVGHFGQSVGSNAQFIFNCLFLGPAKRDPTCDLHALERRGEGCRSSHRVVLCPSAKCISRTTESWPWPRLHRIRRWLHKASEPA